MYKYLARNKNIIIYECNILEMVALICYNNFPNQKNHVSINYMNMYFNTKQPTRNDEHY